MMPFCSKYRARHCLPMIFHEHMYYCSSPHHEEELVDALQEAKLMDKQGLHVSRDIIYDLLQGCFKKKDLASGRHVRSLMVSNGLDFIAPLGDHLIRLFALCGNLLEANGVFLKVSKPSVFTWNAIISAHVNLGEGSKALKLYVKMQQDGLKPDKVTFLCVLKACSSVQALGPGRVVHNQIIHSGLKFDAAIGNTMVDMYAKCGSLEEARIVFDGLPDRDAVSWGVMIAGYVTHECCLPALELFEKMWQEGATSNRVVLSCTLKACGSVRALGLGRLMHDEIEKSGLLADALIGSALVNMYALFGIVEEARKVFDQVQDRNVHMWGEMIAGYAEHGFCDQALQLFESMQHEGIKPDKASCLRILKACGSMGAMRQGRLMHDHIIRSGLESDTMVGNTLVDMFAKCGSLEEAQKVFHTVKNRDVVSWSVMIAAYAQHGDGFPALKLFQKMQVEGVSPSKVSFLGVLKACGSIGDLHQGRRIHYQIANTGLMSDLLIGSTLIDMYAKCGSLKEAREVFDCLPNRNVVVWGAMIAGYAQHGLGVPALELFKKMQRENINPDKVLFSSVLQACGSIGALDQGRLIHDQIIHDGFESHLIVGNTLIDLYAKCRSMEEARRVFDNLTTRDVVTWGTIIAGYAQHGYGLAALELFESTQKEGIELNRVIFLGLLKACGSIGALEQGQIIYNDIVKGALEADLVVCNTLLDMYAKSGSLKEARVVFDGMPHKDEVSWSAMISGYAWCGKWRRVRQCLQTMQQHGMKPDDVTFTNVLTACSQAGLLEEGRWFFRCMREDHDILPSIEHYSCLVDLLSRAGCLNEAQDILRSIPILPDLIIWMSLLTSCKVYGNMDLGKHCFNHSMQLDPNDASGYVLMSSIYSDANMWVDVERMLDLKRRAGAQKKRAMAWIEFKGKVHEFLVGDDSYPQFDKIEALSRQLSRVMRQEFYVPHLDSICKSGFDKDEEDPLSGQLKEFARAFCLFNPPEVSTVEPEEASQVLNTIGSYESIQTGDMISSTFDG